MEGTGFAYDPVARNGHGREGAKLAARLGTWVLLVVLAALLALVVAPEMAWAQGDAMVEGQESSELQVADDDAVVVGEPEVRAADDELEAPGTAVLGESLSNLLMGEDAASAVLAAVAAPTGQDRVVVGVTARWDMVRSLLERTNVERQARGHRPISLDYDLCQAAMFRAAETTIYWDHTRPNGERCFTVMPEKVYGENLAWNHQSVDAVVKGWIASSAHFENMMSDRWNSIGLGCVQVGSSLFWVQLFGDAHATNGGRVPSRADVMQARIGVSYSLTGANNPTWKDGSGNTLASSYTLTKGASQTAKAYLTNNGPNVQRYRMQINLLGSTYTWSSGNSAIAAVSSDGRITGQGTGGTVTITARSAGGYTKRIQVTNPTQDLVVLRLYNPNSGEHFYTTSGLERDSLVAAGWKYEGEGWKAPRSGGQPVYRLYNPNAGDHHYTMNAAERNMLVSVGWQYEGTGWNSSATAGSTPLYRLYNPNALAGSHHYTTSVAESNMLQGVGWKYENVAWYAEP